jgi:hypothetical protein
MLQSHGNRRWRWGGTPSKVLNEKGSRKILRRACKNITLQFSMEIATELSDVGTPTLSTPSMLTENQSAV